MTWRKPCSVEWSSHNCRHRVTSLKWAYLTPVGYSYFYQLPRRIGRSSKKPIPTKASCSIPCNLITGLVWKVVEAACSHWTNAQLCFDGVVYCLWMAKFSYFATSFAMQEVVLCIHAALSLSLDSTQWLGCDKSTKLEVCVPITLTSLQTFPEDFLQRQGIIHNLHVKRWPRHFRFLSFWTYPLERTYTKVTDNKLLVGLLHKYPMPIMMAARIQCLSLLLEHTSRKWTTKDTLEELPECVHLLRQLNDMHLLSQVLRELSKKDLVLTKVKSCVLRGWPK